MKLHGTAGRERLARRSTALSWRAKLTALLVSFVLIAVGTATYVALQTQEGVFRRTTLDALTALAKAKADVIEQFTDDRRRYVERLAPLIAPGLAKFQEAEREFAALKAAKKKDEVKIEAPLPELQDAEELERPDEEARPQENGDGGAAADVDQDASEDEPDDAEEFPAIEEAKVALRRTLGFISWDQESFEELLVLDAAGHVVVSSFKGHEKTTAENIEYFKKGLKATYLQPVFRSTITEGLTMVIATPIYDNEHDLIGVLVARLNLKRFFQRIGDTTGLGETGETVVGKKRDHEIVFMAPTRHDADAALQRKFALGEEGGRLLQDAATGRVGAGEGTDYRGERVLAAWQHVPSIDWGLVVKMDRDEAMRAVEDAKRSTALLAGIISLLAIAASLAAARAFVQPLRELQAATDRISRGDLDVSLEIRSRDEIGDLADSFERMVAAIKFFREHAKREDDEPEEAEELLVPQRSEVESA